MDKFFFYLFLTSLSFFKIPGFYLVPFVQNTLFSTQVLARILLALVFLYNITVRIYKKNPAVENKKTLSIILLITLLFFVQSLSVISAINIPSFINRYKDVVVGIMSFFVFYFYRQKYLQIIAVFVGTTVLNLLFGSIIMFGESLFRMYSAVFVYQKYLVMLMANLDRGRLYIPTFDEILIPILFFIQMRKANIKWVSFPLLVAVAFFSLASNFRTNFFMLIFGLTVSMVVFKNIGLKKILLAVLGFFIIAVVANSFVFKFAGYSFYDRFTSTDDGINPSSSTSSRVLQVKKSLEIGSSSLTGVGLGNYYDNLPFRNKIYSPDSSNALLSENAQEYVHNMFAIFLAESGYPALILFILLTLKFVVDDIRILKSKEDHKKSFVLAFWALFIFGFFNPTVSGTFQFLFWGLRGLLL